MKRDRVAGEVAQRMRRTGRFGALKIPPQPPNELFEPQKFHRPLSKVRKSVVIVAALGSE
jgi:hypothetical protein